METQAEKLKLWKNDPLLNLLKQKFGFSDLRITLLFIFLAAVTELGLGWVASSQYTGSGIKFTDPAGYSFALARTFFFIPLLFFFYLRQPGLITDVFKSFEETKVIQGVSDKSAKKVASYSDFLTKFETIMNRKRWGVFALVFIISFWVIELGFVWPRQFDVWGQSAFWYDVKWYLAVRTITLSLWLFVLWMVVVRQVTAVVYFNHFFQWFDVKVHPMHPDRAGGLGALGDFALKSGVIAVGFGVIAFLFSVLIWISGENPLTRADILILWLLYIFVAGLSLQLPMLSAHNEMKNVRSRKLYVSVQKGHGVYREGGKREGGG